MYTYGEERFPEVLSDERIWFEPLTDENVPVAKKFMRKAVQGLLDAEVEQGLLRGIPIVDGKSAAPPLGNAFKVPGSFWFAWKTPLEIIDKPRVLTAEVYARFSVCVCVCMAVDIAGVVGPEHQDVSSGGLRGSGPVH